MEDPRAKLLKIFKDAEEVRLKNVSINADSIGFEIKPGAGGVPPQIPIRVQYNNQIFTGLVTQNQAIRIKKEE